MVSTLIVVGVFNRPTFAFFAVVPYLFWLLSDGVHRVAVKAVNSVFMAVAVSVVFVVSDSVYFGHLDINNLNFASFGDIVSFLTRNITVTPLNFVLYNTQAGNLASHGIHPRFTHFAVNIPLLFSILSVSFYYDICWWCASVVAACKRNLISRYWRQLILLLCCVVPVSLLSIFPHQESRFLIPMLPAFAALYADKVTTSRWRLTLWFITNTFGCLFYGSIHQAGVVPCLGYLQRIQSTSVDYHMIFWHTYTAPQHLLMLPRHSAVMHVPRAAPLTSLEGNSIEDLINHLTQVNSSQQDLGKVKVMVAAPSSEHHYLVCKTAEAGIRLSVHKSFWPHLSTEHPPKIDEILCNVPASTSSCLVNTEADADDGGGGDLCDKSLIDRLMFLTSLNLYQVRFL